MKVTAAITDLNAIQHLRNLFLQEGNFQFIRNSFHDRNWADSYLLSVDGAPCGYGSLLGSSDRSLKDTVFEFYVVPSCRKMSDVLFAALLSASKATIINCQSNDFLIAGVLYGFAKNIHAETILFKDHAVTALTCGGVTFRPKKDDDKIFEHKAEPEGNYVLETSGEVVATGGFLLHYNLPFADLYMEVKEGHRRKGLGSFLIQELRKQCYLAGRVPAARCGLGNKASKATLFKAGLTTCGYMLTGTVKDAAEW